jgi:hypothetical protein
MESQDNVFQLLPLPTFFIMQQKVTIKTASLGVFNFLKRPPDLLFSNDPEKII